MKKTLENKILALILIFTIFVPSLVKAEQFDSNKQSYIYGAGLNESQIQEVRKKLDLSDDINIASVNANDLQRYLGYSTSDYDMISSVAVKKLPKGSGIKVDIKTPDYINSITEGQYTNAAITAGITDAEIKVASPKPVTGESALVGVYKAVELSGNNIDTERTKTAQEELGTLKKISEENSDNSSFDKGKLDQVVAEVKQDLQQYKEKNGQTADSNQIKMYIEDALKNVNMGDILSNNNIQILINYFEQYQETSAIDSQDVKENLKKFAGDVTEKGKKFYEDNKDEIDKVGNNIKESGLLDKIINFIKDIFNSLFGSNKSTE
ncbi:DUF1002 domain-containing protein [Anaerococcus porci]|uniref:DUF1002 domain-containing protein n=1 Tax=Anaerococcus porci TaxID=2652269 RepID=UPI002A76236F|nr:DUF1002 domain-containing protein [Anaerococcus porci]MDY3006512.1 DUF1002 domain-containing protein [Anaerococcus porci]